MRSSPQGSASRQRSSDASPTAISGDVGATAMEDIARVDERIARAEFGWHGLVLDPILRFSQAWLPGTTCVAPSSSVTSPRLIMALIVMSTTLGQAERMYSHHHRRHGAGLGPPRRADVHDLPSVDPVRPAVGEQDSVGDGGVDLVVEHVEVGVVEQRQREKRTVLAPTNAALAAPIPCVAEPGGNSGTRRSAAAVADRGPVKHAFAEATVSAEGLQHVVERGIGG